ncbi:MAG: prephenate dehydrogenase/arogenate dehydrogenase family protein [Oscillospiraceae bacterium]|nr:prephenate dehydrogenase/arogenate dehydrogenase family protein [Oscillospiraceae bacterium]
MIVGILGLGLIGGSLSRAYAKHGHTVYAADKNDSILEFAQLAGVVQGKLDCDTIPCCDLILPAIYTNASAQWLQENASYIRSDAFVIDCCGIKQKICDCGFALAAKYGFTFIGGHPMAGSHFSGFKYSRSNLFQGAPMVLVPPRFDDPMLLEQAKEMLKPCNFGSFSVTTAANHDKMIAFTSQMPHIVSNAYIKSPTAVSHNGFSAGSYKDLTRVAWLNPQMWAELLLSNKENILEELDFYMKSLTEYKNAIESGDEDTLIRILDEGRRRKVEADG